MNRFLPSRSFTRLACLALTMSVSGVAACQRAETTTPQSVAQTASRPHQEGLESLTMILRTSDADLDKSRRAVIRDSVAWSKIWGKLVGRHLVPPAIPHVAFDSDMVIVAAAGSQLSGYRIQIDSVRVQKGELVIYLLESHQGRTCSVSTMDVISPAHAVKVRRIAERERFVERLVVRECRRQ